MSARTPPCGCSLRAAGGLTFVLAERSVVVYEGPRVAAVWRGFESPAVGVGVARRGGPLPFRGVGNR